MMMTTNLKEKDNEEMIEIFNKDWTRKGFIKKEGDNYTIYNERWERKGYIKSIKP